jgi:plasmid rolling circle replication initiator protein Rep
MVKKEYFSKSNEKYITTEKWVHLWRTSAKLDYDPVCDIRKVRKTKKNISKTVAEIAKYTVKDSDYIGNDEVIKTLTDAIFRKRLYAYGGVIAKASKALKIRKPDSGDLVHIDNDAIRDDVAYVIVKYGWSFGVGDYLRM